MNQVVCSVWCKPTNRFSVGGAQFSSDRHENAGRPWLKPHYCQNPSALRWTHGEVTLLSTSCCQQSRSILISVLWKALFWRKKLSAVELSWQATTNSDPGWVYIVKYCCLHLAVVVHDFIQSVNQIFKAWFWTACRRLAFQCLCWIYGAPLAQILCSAWEHTRKYWFTLELIGIAAFWDIWILIALINLAIKTVNMLPTQKRILSRSEARSHYHIRKWMCFWFKFWCEDGSNNGSLLF